MVAAVSGLGAAFSPSKPLAAPGLLHRAQGSLHAAWEVAKLAVSEAGDKIGMVALQILGILRPELGMKVLVLLHSIRDIVRTVIDARRQAALVEQMEQLKQQNAALLAAKGQLEQRNSFLEQHHPEVSNDRAFLVQEKGLVVAQNMRLKEENERLTAEGAALASVAAERDQLARELQELKQQLPLLQNQVPDRKLTEAGGQRPGNLLLQWLEQIERDRAHILTVKDTIEGAAAKCLLQDIHGRLGRLTSKVAQFVPAPQLSSPHKAPGPLLKLEQVGA